MVARIKYEISNNLTSVDLNEHLQPPFRLRNSKFNGVQPVA